MCKVEGCENTLHEALGYCQKHYVRFKKHGDPNYEYIRERANCIYDGCDKKAVGMGYCNKHYKKFHEEGEIVYKRPQTNGRTKLPEYRVWKLIRQRCFNPTASHYDLYGGRGITMCKRWDSFDNFIADMGKRPSPKHQIDRVNNDGSYEPSNCRWVLPITNTRNRRNTIKPEIVERIKSMIKDGYANIDIVNSVGVSHSKISHIRNGRSYA